RKNSGKHRRKNTKKIKNKSSPKLCGDLSPHQCKEPMAANNKNKQLQEQQLHQQIQNSNNCKQNTKEKNVKQQTGKKNGKDQGKQSVTMDTEGTPRSKNKPSKQKRDAENMRQNRQQNSDSEHEQGVREESCNRFVMVDDNQGLDILPLQIHSMTPSTLDHSYNKQQKSKVNPEPILDEYVVLNSEDELVLDNQSLDDYDDND
ncbi:hypothetical protein EJD97_015841, partial [Solanum chilense]